MNMLKVNSGFIILAVALMLSGCGDPDKGAEKFQLDLDKYKKVDPALIHYKEIENILPNIGKLTAIAVDSSDSIYIAGERAIKVFDSKRGEKANIPLNAVIKCMTIDKDNKLFIGTKDHVIVYDPSKENEKERKTGWQNLGPKTVITSIAVSDDAVFVADAGTRSVWHFDKSGEVISRINGADEKSKQTGFIIPSPYFDLVVDSNETLWIVNPGKQSVQSFRKTGELVSSWGTASVGIEGFCGCCNPSHIAVMSDGSFVTSEKGIVRIKTYDSAGRFTGVVAAPATFDDGTVGVDLAVDSKKRVIALDTSRDMVRIFEVKEDIVK